MMKPNLLDAMSYVYSVQKHLNADSHEEVKMKLAIYGESKVLEAYEACQNVINECVELCKEKNK